MCVVSVCLSAQVKQQQCIALTASLAVALLIESSKFAALKNLALVVYDSTVISVQ